jgi:phosphatidylglycerophosphate synthase
VIDARLRPLKDRLLDPVAGAAARRCGPLPFTVASLGLGLGAALAAASGLVIWSVVLWLTGRVSDGLDGAVARRRGVTSDLGGYLDILGDTVVYAAVPIGVAVAVDQRAAWIAVAFLLAAFYVNAVSWAVLSALLEKRRPAREVGSAPSVHMPAGLIEGAETIVLYTLLLAFPGQATSWFVLMAVLVGVTIVQRLVIAASRTLHDTPR